MWVFFIGYFHVLRNPVYPVTVMPLTPLDEWVAFQPAAMVAYLSLWLYVGIAPGLLWSLRALIVHGVWASALCITGLLCFYFWPQPRCRPPRWMSAATPHSRCCRVSMPPATPAPRCTWPPAMFTCICLADLLGRIGAPRGFRIVNVLWFIAIAYSTLAVKQHVVVDVMAGATLGVVFALASLRWRPAELNMHRTGYHWVKPAGTRSLGGPGSAGRQRPDLARRDVRAGSPMEFEE